MLGDSYPITDVTHAHAHAIRCNTSNHPQPSPRSQTMTPRQREILTHLANAGPTTRRQLCQLFGIASNTAGAHLHRLAKLGLVRSSGWGDGTRSNGGRWEATNAATAYSKTPPAISQCPSIWHYAARLSRSQSARP